MLYIVIQTCMLSVIGVSLVCALVAGIMIIGVCKLGNTSSMKRNDNVQGRSYSIRANGKRGLERSTLLETSDDEF